MEPRRIRENPSIETRSARARRWRKRLRRLAVVVVLAALLYFGRGLLLPPVARFLNVSEPAQQAQYVMVLGGGKQTRPFVAAALVKAGFAEKVLLPCPTPSSEVEEGLEPREHEVMRQTLRARGVQDDSIVVLPGDVASTLDEARVLEKYLDNQPEASITIVTSNYHTRRARSIFRRILGEKAARLHFVGAPSDGYDESNWWQSEAGFADYVQEYCKLVFWLCH
jgi:uncharacterized SAM-binding protein YcdF (DUF218 family)